MKNIKIFAFKIHQKIIRIYWLIWLWPKVNGRIKLKGNLTNLKIASNFHCDGDIWIGIYNDEGIIQIGENFRASGPLIITAIENIKIRSGILIGPNVMITDHYHGNLADQATFDTPPSQRKLHSNGSINIEKNVQIGANTCILSPSNIGEYSIVGANSVVKGSFIPRTVFGGVPAKVIQKDRNDR